MGVSYGSIVWKLLSSEQDETTHFLLITYSDELVRQQPWDENENLQLVVLTATTPNVSKLNGLSFNLEVHLIEQ